MMFVLEMLFKISLMGCNFKWFQPPQEPAVIRKI
jgi:hypothetical protein